MMSVDQYIRVAADNVVRAISELKIEVQRYRNEIDKKRRELAQHENDMSNRISQESSGIFRGDEDDRSRAARIARAEHTKRELDKLKHEMNDEINRMSNDLANMESQVRSLESQAGSLRSLSGV